MGARHWSTAALAALGTLTACTRSDQVATAPPASTEAPATTAAPTTVAATTVPSSVAATSAAPTTVLPTTAAPTTAAPTTAAPSTPPPTTAAPAPVPTDRVVVVQWGTSPIGVWDGTAWRIQEWGADNLPTFTSPITSVVLTGLGVAAPVTGATYGPPDYFCVGDEQSPTVVRPAGFEPPADASLINVSADWNVQPRPVAQVGLDNPEYQALGASLVDTGSGADPAAGEVTQVVRADLDGNGVEEVLFTFEHQSDDGGFGAAGDYTLIVVRYPRADGSVDDAVLWSFYEEDPVDFPNPATGALLAVADLNGDAVMEVVTEHSYWEANTAEVYALVDGRLVAVAGGGCGV